MKTPRCSIVATAFLWAGATITAERSTESRQFQLDLPPAVVDPDGVPVNLLKWVHGNRVPRVNWSPDHRVGMRLIDETPEPFPGGDPLALIRAANRKVAADQVLEAVAKSAAVKNSFVSEESFQQFVGDLSARSPSTITRWRAGRLQLTGTSQRTAR